MPAKKQATWGGRFSTAPAALMLEFSESVSFDARLAQFDILGSKAHAAMLCHTGLINSRELRQIKRGLDAIAKEVTDGTFKWDKSLEDVHMNIEQALTQRVPAAAKLHTARSRNDQIATDMRLFFRQAAGDLDTALANCLTALLNLAERTRAIYIPGYTHLQRAQPVSMAHHLLAYVEMFGRDRTRLQRFSEDANVLPLGSGAIAGSTLPIDRAFVARELGFVDSRGRPRLTMNSMDAVSDRDLYVEFTSLCAIIGLHFSRLAEDFILWNSAEFRFIRLPDAFTTGSSLMPQKKNPDAFELLRGKAARLQGNLQTLLTLVKGLPLTYNRDLQEDKPPVFDSYDQTLVCLRVINAVVAGAEADPEGCARAVADPLLLATDLVDYLVRRNVAFRDAHHVVGALVARAERTNTPLNKLPTEAVRDLHPILEEDAWREVFDIRKALKAREAPGMPGPETVKKQITAWRKRI